MTGEGFFVVKGVLNICRGEGTESSSCTDFGRNTRCICSSKPMSPGSKCVIPSLFIRKMVFSGGVNSIFAPLFLWMVRTRLGSRIITSGEMNLFVSGGIWMTSPLVDDDLNVRTLLGSRAGVSIDLEVSRGGCFNEGVNDCN